MLQYCNKRYYCRNFWIQILYLFLIFILHLNNKITNFNDETNRMYNYKRDNTYSIWKQLMAFKTMDAFLFIKWILPGSSYPMNFE